MCLIYLTLFQLNLYYCRNFIILIKLDLIFVKENSSFPSSIQLLLFILIISITTNYLNQCVYLHNFNTLDIANIFYHILNIFYEISLIIFFNINKDFFFFYLHALYKIWIHKMNKVFKLLHLIFSNILCIIYYFCTCILHIIS